MEDKKRKKEDKRKREASQKVAEQKNKVPELTKPSSTQSPAAPSSACPSPGPTPSASPSPATAAAGVAPPQGGNNAKRPAVANGQSPAAGTQASQRYMPREVPPRFRCQQDHKVLLKRGQPPLSSMLLGGGTGPGGGGGDCPNATMAAASDSSPGYVGPAAPSLPLTSSSSIAASSTTSSNYANSTWGVGSGSLPSSQGREKVIVDGSDLEEWPSIAVGDGNGAGGGEASGTGSGSASSGEGGGGVPNSSASRKGGDPGSPPSPTSSFSTPNECMLSVSVVWGSAASQGPPGTSVPSIPKASPLPMGPDGSLGGSGVIPGANFNPNANPSAWPALVQQDGAGVASSEGGPPPSLLQSLAGSLSAPGLGNPPLAVNQSAHQHQLHQMQSRDREHTSDGGWGGAALETGAGPKNEGTGVGADTDCGGGGNGGEKLASQTSSSSWGGQPFPAANSKTGASRTDGWEGGAAEGGGGSGWKYSAQGGNGGKSWGAVRGGSTQTPGVSQGGERGSSVGDWGGNSGGMGGGGNPGGEAGGVGGRSSSSSSSGGSNPPAASSSPTTSTTTTRAWDNQKGDGVAGGDTGEWGGGKGGRGGGNSSSGGGNSRGSGNQHHGYGHHRYSHPPPPNPDVALQAMLSRSDLDPRVLSNTGWGQTQIRQNVAWDLEPGKGGSGSSASSQNASPPMGPSSQYSTGSATTTDPMAPTPLPGSAPNLNSNPSLGTPGGSGEGWEVGNNGSSSGSNSMPSQGPPPLGSNMRNPPGVTQSGSMTTGAGIGGGLGPGQGKPTGGWGGVGPGESQGKGWGNEGSEWGCGRERSRGGGGGGWGDNGQQGNQGGGVGGWGGGQEEKGTGGGWKEMGRDGGGWGGQRDRGGGDWGEREPKSSGGGWGEDRKGGGNSGGGDSEVGTWGSWDEGAPRRSWGAGGTGGGGGGGVGGDMGCTKPHQGRWGGGGKMHPSPMPNSQTASVKGAMALQQHSQALQQHSQPPPQQALEPGGGGWVRQTGAQHQNQSSSGWIAGPIPSGPGGGEGPESSGWEEPSPQFISRKMDIDDGTSAWGDPSQFNKKTVNLWEKNGSPAGNQPEMQGQGAGPPTQQQQGLPALQQPGPGRQPTGMGGRDINPGPGRQPTGMGGRDINPGPGRQPTGMGGRDINPGKAPGMAPSSGWDGGSPSDPPVDNGTAAWGKPTETPTGWEDPGKTTSGWGNPSPNPIKSAGSKSMQEGSWGEGDQGSVAASRHSSWEEEEEGGGGVWSSAGSQGSSSSYNSGGWGQGHGGKKPNKVEKDSQWGGGLFGCCLIQILHRSWIFEVFWFEEYYLFDNVCARTNYCHKCYLYVFVSGSTEEWRRRLLDEPHE
uniref:Trinucleotide repeat containing adaptor 6B n=1 Tax=Oncorhynchus mykiss TaxID=8022 RepID=A0A8C7V402_ONCMY